MESNKQPTDDATEAKTVIHADQPEDPKPRTARAPHSRHQALIDKGTSIVERAKTGTAGTLWSRLNAVDFMNSAFQFAALAVICLVRFSLRSPR